jgi:hypothetical protein
MLTLRASGCTVEGSGGCGDNLHELLIQIPIQLVSLVTYELRDLEDPIWRASNGFLDCARSRVARLERAAPCRKFLSKLGLWSEDAVDERVECRVDRRRAVVGVESGGSARVFMGVVGVKCESLIATISSAQTPDFALSRAPK